MEDQRKTVRGVRSTAVGLLERKANDLEQIRGMLSDLGPEVSDDFKCQIETAEELVLNISQELEKGNRPMRNHPTKKKRQGNRPHFPGLVIREFWPVLRNLNYEISAGSRILASSMIKSGWLDRDLKKTSKSLYQLIRDFESRS